MKRKEKKNYLSDLLIRKRNDSNTTCHYIYIYIYIFFFENHLSVVTNQVLLFGEYFDNFRNLTGFLFLSVLACCRMIHC